MDALAYVEHLGRAPSSRVDGLRGCVELCRHFVRDAPFVAAIVETVLTAWYDALSTEQTGLGCVSLPIAMAITTVWRSPHQRA